MGASLAVYLFTLTALLSTSQSVNVSLQNTVALDSTSSCDTSLMDDVHQRHQWCVAHIPPGLDCTMLESDVFNNKETFGIATNFTENGTIRTPLPHSTQYAAGSNRPPKRLNCINDGGGGTFALQNSFEIHYVCS